MKPIKRIVAVTGKYTDQQGQSKNRYTNIGTLFERPDGSQAIKLESIPLGWDGWGNFYDLDNKQQTAHNQQKQDAFQPQGEEF